MNDTDNAKENLNIDQQIPAEINSIIQSPEAQISKEDESLGITLAEQREIDTMAELESKEPELLDDGKNNAKTKRDLKQPGYGPVKGSVHYHTRNTFRFVLGREKSHDSYYVIGLFQAATNIRQIVQGYLAGCPYAAWYLVQTETLISKVRAKIKSVEHDAQTLINNATSIQLLPFTSERPAVVPLDFRVVYGFHFADLLAHYDHILRLVKSYEIQRFITHDDFRDIEEKLGRPLRHLFHLSSRWSFVGKDAVNQQTAVAMAAEHKMGILPDEILSGEHKPMMV